MPSRNGMSDGGDSADLRPPSDNLVDLHISVVPMEHWVERLNYASHKIIGDTFSAGFIRVLPETSVVKLRYDIADQLGNDIFPKDYVFLKHVGRCLALVREKQERQLKVKNFLPPHSIMPEIFVLPGQPTMYSYSVLPPIKPRIQDLYNPHSDNESSIQSIHTGQEQIPSLKPYSNINSLRASQDSLQISQDMSSNQQTQTYPSLRPGREPVGASKSRQNGYSVAQTPQQKVDGKHRRHVSGKSNYDQETGLPKTPNNFSLAQRGKTVPGQTVDASPANFTQSSVPLSPNLEEVKPTQAKSVFREGLKKRRVRYNMPPRPESNVSSLDLDTNNPPNDLRVNPDYLHNSLHNADTPQSNSPLDDDRHALHNDHFDTANDSDSPEHFSPNHNYTRPKRKQFVDTSSHAFANGNQGAPWNSFENPAYFSHHPYVHNSTPSQLNQNMRGDFKNDHKVNNFGMGGDSSNVELNPDENPNTVLEHQSRSQRESRTSVNENHNNSPNNDSGFVENEMSDADVYPKVTDGRLHSRELEHGLVQQKEPAVTQSLPTGDDTNRVRQSISKSNNDPHDSDYDNHSLPGSIDSWGNRVNHSRESFSSNKPSDNHPAVAELNKDVDLSESGNVSTETTEIGLHSDNERDLRRSSRKSIVMENISDPRAVEKIEENPHRVMSQDSSYQYDFYERSGPHVPAHSDEDEENESQPPPASPMSHGHGSRLSYRLSEQGYRVESAKIETTEPPQSYEEYQKELNSVIHYNLQRNATRSPNQVVSGLQFEENEDDQSEDSDGYESSNHDFQRELENLTARQAEMGAQQAFNELNDSDILHDEDSSRPHNTAPDDIISPSSDAETHQDVASTDILKVDAIPERDLTPCGGEVPEAVPVSGYADLREGPKDFPPAAAATAVIAFVAAGNVISQDDMDDQKQSAAVSAFQNLFKEDTVFESGQSRGAPDGMPTQRKLNTSDKFNDTQFTSGLVTNPTTAQGLNNDSDGVNEGKRAISPKQSAEKKVEVKPAKLDLKEINGPLTASPTKPTQENYSSTRASSRQIPSQNTEPVEKEDTLQPPPSQISSSQYHKPAEERMENLASASSSPTTTTPVVVTQGTAQITTIKSIGQNGKRLGRSDRAKLWEELQKIRTERRQTEKTRQDLVKQAKVATSKMNQKRSSVNYKDHGTKSWKCNVIEQASNQPLKKSKDRKEPNVVKPEQHRVQSMRVRKVHFDESCNTARVPSPPLGVLEYTAN
ncbi:uncharacterized protein LOC143461015 isoform X2 [Clavelina lepadiformis]|uniref:uncharacterized protein LOC143461015 isoform X2 n=1 Tax=Clavelina lepadiformis TaxID=159417 RepID=UPI00404245D0